MAIVYVQVNPDEEKLVFYDCEYRIRNGTLIITDSKGVVTPFSLNRIVRWRIFDSQSET